MSIIGQRILKREIKHFRLTEKEDERWRKQVTPTSQTHFLSSMSLGKKSSASAWNIFTWVTDTLLPWNKLRSCSNKNRSCYLPLLTDDKVKELCWVLELQVALPQNIDINGRWAISHWNPPQPFPGKLLSICALPQVMLLCISIATTTPLLA